MAIRQADVHPIRRHDVRAGRRRRAWAGVGEGSSGASRAAERPRTRGRRDPRASGVMAGGSVDDGVALLPQELGDVVHRQAGLAGRAGALPAAERLDARPRAGGRAGAPVDVQDAGLDLVEEALDLGLVLGVDAGGQAVDVVVREPAAPRRASRRRATAVNGANSSSLEQAVARRAAPTTVGST